MTNQPMLPFLKWGFLFAIILSGSTPATAQTNVAINATGIAAHPSAILDVNANSAGLLMPRMTQAERDAIVNPAEGLIIYQTDNGAGFWYYDATIPGWRMLSRYMSGRVDMGDPPSVIMQGNGFTVTRLATGADEVNFNESLAFPPSVILTSAQSDGSAPFLEDYCAPQFQSCSCHQIARFRLVANMAANQPPFIIDNWDSFCNFEPYMYKFYEPGNAVYPESVPDLCLGTGSSTSKYSISVRGFPEFGDCSTHHIYVWIDWQQDGFYDDMNDKVYDNTFNWNSGDGILGNQNIPPTAYSGDTFVRVVARATNEPNPCSSGQHGETEEYQITIGDCRPAPVYSDVPTYCNIGDVSTTSFRVACRRVGGESRNVQHYYFQVNETDY